MQIATLELDCKLIIWVGIFLIITCNKLMFRLYRIFSYIDCCRIKSH